MDEFIPDWYDKTVPVVINCDGYYPECGGCGCWLSLKDKTCPDCKRTLNWRNLLDEKENK